jgi:hypothetical protein
VRELAAFLLSSARQLFRKPQQLLLSRIIQLVINADELRAPVT